MRSTAERRRLQPVAWTIGAVALALFIVTRFGSIRVSREEEIHGLDFAEHGSSAYELRGSLLENSDVRIEPSFQSGLADRLNNLGKKHSEKLS